MANDITTSNKKKSAPKNKSQTNKIEVKGDKKNLNEKQPGVQYYAYSGYSYYAHEYANRKKKGKAHAYYME